MIDSFVFWLSGENTHRSFAEISPSAAAAFGIAIPANDHLDHKPLGGMPRHIFNGDFATICKGYIMKHTSKLIKFLFATTLGFANIAQAQDHDVESVTLTEIRGMVFCEFLLITEKEVTIYNTSANGECDLEVFKTLDPAEIAADHNVKMAQFNGPKYWIMDEQTLGLGETKTFGGIKARYAATLPLAALGSGKGADPYAPYITQKAQKMVFYADHPVFELVDADGNAYVLNAYGAEVKDADPANLGQQLTPAEGWNFRTRVLDTELVIVQKGDQPSRMVGDDLHQYYSFETKTDG